MKIVYFANCSVRMRTFKRFRFFFILSRTKKWHVVKSKFKLDGLCLFKLAIHLAFYLSPWEFDR